MGVTGLGRVTAGVMLVLSMSVAGCSDENAQSSTGRPSPTTEPSPTPSETDSPAPHILRSKRVTGRSRTFSILVPSNWGYEQSKKRLTVIAQQPASGTRIYIWQVRAPDPPVLSMLPESSLFNFDSKQKPRLKGRPKELKIDGVDAITWDVMLGGRSGDRFRYVDAAYKGYLIDIAYVPGVDATFSREIAILERILESWRWK